MLKELLVMSSDMLLCYYAEQSKTDDNKLLKIKLFILPIINSISYIMLPFNNVG